MKRALGFLAGVLLCTVEFSMLAAPRDRLWNLVGDAVNKGLPRTAISNLDLIIPDAQKAGAYAEATKAIARKISLEGVIQGNKPEEKIVRLEAQIAQAPPQTVPVMNALLADWYWQYFQQNNWRFMQRTATEAAPGKDFTTWDLPRLFAEIDKTFTQALSAEATLKSTPISAWDDLIEKGSMPDAQRPTLYDFVVREALEFYTSGEQGAARPEDSFEISADSPIFEPPADFIAWVNRLQAAEGAGTLTDTNSPALKALFLYRDLMRFHETAGTLQAAAAADLERLDWGWNAAFGESKNARFEAALESFISRHADLDLAAMACEREAGVFQQEGDLLAAHEVAKRGQKLFPGSPGGRLCGNLIAQIEAKSANISTERVWNAPWPDITVQYRNVTNVYFRAIPVDWEMFLARNHHRPENLSDPEKRQILLRPSALVWSEKLPPTPDFKERTLKLKAQAQLKPGYYFIAASHDPNFGESDNVVSMTSVWVSDLALITRVQPGKIEGFVLEANSGEPVVRAQVTVWHLNNNGDRVADPALTTDANGMFSMNSEKNRAYLFLASDHGRELASANDLQDWWQDGIGEQPFARTIFFTDRAIYRPGQAIHYKGICIWADPAKNDYSTLRSETVTVVFRDLNGKEIARQTRTANDYGSFSGDFTAPRDHVMGQMWLQAEGRATGNSYFRVEEYKRPKFEVTLEAPKTAAKLNEKVVLTGHATGYTGAAVDGALVKYRVQREVRMPWWWGWYWRGPRYSGSDSQEIAHGTARTGTDGSVTIEFIARPDPKVAETNEPTFTFGVTLDVTDSAGETRSANRDIRIGYTALEATLEANEWETADKPVEIKIATKTLDGDAQSAAGTVRLYELQPPDKVQRADLQASFFGGYRGVYFRPPAVEEESTNLSDPNHWPLGAVAAEQLFRTDTNGEAKLSLPLRAGAYRAVLETQDRFGKKVTGRLPIQVLKPDDLHLALKIPHLLAAPAWETQPGDEFMALWGTGYDEGRALVEIEHGNQIIQRFWTHPGQTQQAIKLAVTEDLRGGFTLHVTQVRENRAYMDSQRVDVPWKNKELSLKWEHFTSKLMPGQKDTWTAVISGPAAEKSISEMVATLYDESLDAFVAHTWPGGFGVFHQDYSNDHRDFLNFTMNFEHGFGQFSAPYDNVEITHRHLPDDIKGRFFMAYTRAYGGGRLGFAAPRSAAVTLSVNGAVEQGMVLADQAAANDDMGAFQAGAPSGGGGVGGDLKRKGAAEPAAPPAPADLAKVSIRKNLTETAFFFPQLISDSNGEVRMAFSMPEALTKWHFLGFAHDSQLRAGLLEGHTVTAKDIMVQPNPPRFLREGDTVEFTVKVSNQSARRQTGRVRLTFAEIGGDVSADALLGNTRPDQSFDIPAGESRGYSWRITVPDSAPFLSYKAVAATSELSDGEEGGVPVLSRRILVTESLPLPIRGPATNRFEFKKLADSGQSKTLKNESLTVQMTSNPAWYAVLALPYLMEYPYECSEQTFNRLYANALARHIANSNPRIHAVFEQWRNTPALDSPLEKNQELKSVAIEETPWLRQAQGESQARRNVGILFEDNRLDAETEATLRKLAEMQLGDGRWPWFPGGPGDDYITLYIVTGFGRLRHLNAGIDAAPALRALNRLDEWMTENYDRIQHLPEPDKYVPSATDAMYLYGRSFFLSDAPIAPRHQAAIGFFLRQSRTYWLQTGCRMSQGQMAIALKRWGGSENLAAADAILNSLRERSVTDPEMGMFWRDTEFSWWWYRAPIETQALMIEAFDEVAGDSKAVEDCKVWLLKQKQTQDWRTTKATADAVYALLLRGTDLLASTALTEVTIGGVNVTPGKEDQDPRSETRSHPEAGTGFYEVRFAPGDIKPRMGEISVRKPDAGVAWGAVHWQYLEDMTKVTPYEGTPLKLSKALFRKVNTARGQVLEPVKGPLAVGDELVVRIELRTDRDMEYVHLKDQRGSGTEPVNVLSRYKYQDGLAYYESTRDTASHFFISYLPKGVYVFEYSTRVQLRGEYQTGIAEIQCMYAPEFNSHSESLPLVVK
jgi:hypothetical protein